MAKRNFVFNFPSQAETTITAYGSKPQSALMRQGFAIMYAYINYMEAVENGNPNEIEEALYAIILCTETGLRMNEKFHNVNEESYIKYGRAVSYDDGVDKTVFFEEE